MRAAVSLLLLCLLASCGNDRTQRRRTEPDAGVGCGNGTLEEGEQCDGTDFGVKSCVTEGFDQGTLNCTPSCELSTASCVRRCGNGQLDLGEECDGELGKPGCADFGYGSCTVTCKRDLGHCVNDPFVSGGGLAQAQGAGTFLSDLHATGVGDLVTAVPQLGKLQTFEYAADQGFVSRRTLSTGKLPIWPLVAQLDGVEGLDIAVIDQSTGVDRFRFVQATNSFTLESLSRPLDGGSSCLPYPFVGAARLDPDALDDLVLYGCQDTAGAGQPDDFVIIRGGPAPLAPEIVTAGNVAVSTLADLDADGLVDILYTTADAPTELRGFRTAGAAFQPLPARALSFAPSQLAAADLDGDGDQDLVAADATTVRTFENTGSGLVEKSSRSASAVFLRAQDLDLDGRPDVWLTTADKVEILRAAGAFTFTPWTESFGGDGGTPLNANAWDADGDGDPDLAATWRTGPESTVTRLLLNRVR